MLLTVSFHSVFYSENWSASCFKNSWKSRSTSGINLDSPIWNIKFCDRDRNIFKFKEKTFLSWIVTRLSLLLFGSLDGSAQPVAFTYYAATSTLNLETLSLKIGADWKVHIQ